MFLRTELQISQREIQFDSFVSQFMNIILYLISYLEDKDSLMYQ